MKASELFADDSFDKSNRTSKFHGERQGHRDRTVRPTWDGKKIEEIYENRRN